MQTTPYENPALGNNTEGHAQLLTIESDTAQKIEFLHSQGIDTEDWWQLPRDAQFEKLGKLIGTTPLTSIQLPRGGTSFLKQEFTNPSGSHYDRAYFDTIKHFESIGFIHPGDELRDITSGSAGISLALIGKLLGYNVRITVPDELPEPRLLPMRLFGATVVKAGAGYVPQASAQQVQEILAMRDNPEWVESRPADRSGRAFVFENSTRRICYLNHSENDLSPLAFAAIGKEIVQQAGRITHLVLAEGNWTTIAGIAPAVRDLTPDTYVIGYSGELHEGVTVNYGTNVPDVPIRFKNQALIDADLIVTDAERDRLSTHYPEYGRSTAMGLSIADAILSQQPDSRVVTIGYDLANRY